jgi:hypothetical protein
MVTFRNRETLFALILIFLLILLTVLGAIGRNEGEAAIPLDNRSTAPDGARALYAWLGEIGYTVDDSISAEYEIPDGTGLVFLLEPSGLTGPELDVLTEWVKAGGVLIFAGRLFGTVPLLAAFDVVRGYVDETAGVLAPVLPALVDPPVEEPVPVETSSYLEPEFADYLPLVALPEGPVVIAFDHGDGRVILSAATRPFTNTGLKQAGAGAFVLNLVREAPAGAPIWFDEWHHGRRPVVQGPAGPGDWLRRTPSGRAVLFAAAAIFVWIALSGRAFGRPVPLSEETTRRAPLEYITAIANLNQRAGNRADLLAHYHRHLKQALAARYRIDPGLPDEEFIGTLRKYDPVEDLETLSQLLADLRRPGVSETELVRLSAEASDWLEARAGG